VRVLWVWALRMGSHYQQAVREGARVNRRNVPVK
jgi:hypothetical protein